MLYILSFTDLKITDTIPEISGDTEETINQSGKSFFTVIKKPLANEGDFIIQKDADEIIYQGIVDYIETVKENMIYKIHVKEMGKLFDRKIIVSNESLIASVGIEDFISQTIHDQFTHSTDTILNIPYIQVVVNTHTKVSAQLETDRGVLNFCTYIGNVMETYGIGLTYQFDSGNNVLTITIEKLADEQLNIDATLQDVIQCVENYKVDAIAKVTVLALDTNTQFHFFLKTDRTITTNVADLDRAKGKIETVYCEKDTDAYQRAVDTFKGNSYQHNIVMSIDKNSKLIDANELFIGRKLCIKTRENGIYETFIASISKRSNTNIYTVTCGNMKITLLQKLREVI